MSQSIPINFCCLGPQRTASSWLQEVLACHPEICLPQGVKETMFFDSRYDKGLDWYNWHFQHRNTQQQKACGEIAPTYFHSRQACDRMQELAPALKIIIMVRHPVDRAFSLYRHHLSKGRIRGSFQDALKTRPELITTGKYSQHAAYWESRFPAGEFLYLWQENVQQDPQSVLDEVCDFVGVSRIEIPAIARETVNSASAPRNRLLALAFSSMATLLRSLRLHRLVNFGRSLGLKSVYEGGQTVEKMPESVRESLCHEFEPDIAWLENRLGRDLSHWRHSENTTND